MGFHFPRGVLLAFLILFLLWCLLRHVPSRRVTSHLLGSSRAGCQGPDSTWFLFTSSIDERYQPEAQSRAQQHMRQHIDSSSISPNPTEYSYASSNWLSLYFADGESVAFPPWQPWRQSVFSPPRHREHLPIRQPLQIVRPRYLRPVPFYATLQQALYASNRQTRQETGSRMAL